MAKNEQLEAELDLGAEKKKPPLKKILILVLAGLLFMGLNAGLTWWLVGHNKPASGDATEEEMAEEEATEEDEEAAAVLPALYHPLDPAFVVNLPSGSKAKIMQVQVQLMTRDPKMLDFLKNNAPMIRHSILTLLSVQDPEKLREREGKERLQQEVLAEVRKIAEAEKAPSEVEAVFFTGFVMQ